MIGYLRGEILEYSDGKMLVGIGTGLSSSAPATGGGSTPGLHMTSGVIGYLVSVPQSSPYSSLIPGQGIELFIYSHIREEAFDLYGFKSRFEKELFLTLLGVNGIGPKSALGVLSGADPFRLIEAILTGDQGFLARTPGIGKKTAERVVMELKDVVRKKVELGVFPRQPVKIEESLEMFQIPPEKSSYFSMESSIVQDARGALLGLGYRDQDIQPILRKAWEGQSSPPERAEELIRNALRYLS